MQGKSSNFFCVRKKYTHNVDRTRSLGTCIQCIFELFDVTLNMSQSYHPQIDGQTERLNECLEAYLRCLVQACLTKWAQWLP
jgi:hypothetical protein